TEKPQSLIIPSLPTPSLDYTPATPHSSKESEPIEASKTRIASPHSTTSPSDSTSPLSPDHPLTQTSPTLTPSRAFFYRSTACMAVRTQPTLSLGISARVTEAMTLSPSSFRKRYRGTSELIEDTEVEGTESKTESEELEDEGPGSDREKAASKDQQQQALTEGSVPSTFEEGQSSRSVPDQQIAYETPTPRLPVRTTWVDPEDDIVYIDIEFDEPPVRASVQTPASPEWSSGSLPVSPASLTIPTPVASPVPTTSVGEGDFLEIEAQLELHGSRLHDYTECLDAFPPTLFKGYGRDFTELFARLVAVREEIHSQRFKLRSLEQGNEQATITFGALWRPVLAIEAWAGQTDAQRAALWQARYKD
ncbi:hypothetical protein Tco_1534212, partial [Tanacetum coccineum]